MGNDLVMSTTDELVVSAGFENSQSFEFAQRVAKALSSSTLVPEAYRAMVPIKGNRQGQMAENPSAMANCLISLNMASRIHADPLMVMQNLNIIEGRPAWSSQFVIAAINSCGRFSPLRFDISAQGPEREAPYESVTWENGQKYTKKATVKVRDRTCRAWAIEKGTSERLEGPEVSIEMAIAEGWLTKKGSKWQTMPELMLRYRAAAFFGRLYAPELLMGLPSADEAHDVIDMGSVEIVDVTPPPPLGAPPRSKLDQFETDAPPAPQSPPPSHPAAAAAKRTRTAKVTTVGPTPEDVTPAQEAQPVPHAPEIEIIPPEAHEHQLEEDIQEPEQEPEQAPEEEPQGEAQNDQNDKAFMLAGFEAAQTRTALLAFWQSPDSQERLLRLNSNAEDLKEVQAGFTARHRALPVETTQPSGTV